MPTPLSYLDYDYNIPKFLLSKYLLALSHVVRFVHLTSGFIALESFAENYFEVQLSFELAYVHLVCCHS